MSFWNYYFGGGEERKKIVGPLYGQLTFEAVPDTKKIIVISKIPEAYKIIEELIHDLDKQEMAEVPKVITLNYADPEDLAVRLNAIFNEPGTVAPIWLSERGLSEYSMEETDDRNKAGSDEKDATEGQYTPPWSKARPKLDEMSISNVIGRIRFIPDPRSKSMLVLAPPEFMDSIEEMIKELDTPGKQVMIKAIIVEVDHSNMTSLGLQLSSDPAKWATLDNENAITSLTRLTLLEERGSLILNAATEVTALVDFLVKKVDAKILNQQTLWTKDNEEAKFFKGDKVAFLKGSTLSPEGRVTSRNVEFERVGMVLRARPSITPEKNVDMIINVILWQLTSETINNQPVRTGMETETNMIVQDGQTIMLGGILFRKDSTIERKIPLFGDLPLVGGLFRHEEVIEANKEMLVFITPYVIDEAGDMLPETIEEMERPKEKLKSMLEQLEAAIQ
jgi:type II secretory pathway component GspD/PulD (secretin)